MSALRQRRDVGVVGRRVRAAVGAGDLHVGLAGSHERQQRGEAGLVDPRRRRLRAAEVIEHDRDRRRRNLIPDRVDDRQRRVHLDVPGSAPELLDGRLQAMTGGSRIGLAGRREVDPDAAHARLVHRIERRGGHPSRRSPRRRWRASRAGGRRRACRRCRCRRRSAARSRRGPCAARGAARASPRSTPAPGYRRGPAAKGNRAGSPKMCVWQSHAPAGTSKSHGRARLRCSGPGAQRPSSDQGRSGRGADEQIASGQHLGHIT